MIKEPVVIKHNESLIQLIELFESTNIKHLVIVDDNKQVIGMISRTDLYKKIKWLSSNTSGRTYTEKYLTGTTAKDIMTANPVVLNPEDSLAYAAELLLEKQFHSLPVVKEKEPVGIVTVFDIIKAYKEAA